MKRFQKKAQNMKWAFVGLGAINSIIALYVAVRLGVKEILIITRDLAEDFIFPTNGEVLIAKPGTFCAVFAAGIGCIFRPSSKFVGSLVKLSYKYFMKLARDDSQKHIRLTRITLPCKQRPNYAGWVEDFKILPNGMASYLSYSFSPKGWLVHRTNELREIGVEIKHQKLSPAQILRLKNDQGLEGADMTVSALGLAHRVIKPETVGIAGVLVRLPKTAITYPEWDKSEEGIGRSYMQEEDENGFSNYLVEQPFNEDEIKIVIGGTFYVGYEDMDEDFVRSEAAAMITRTEATFGLKIDCEQIEGITAGLRPGATASSGEPTIDVFEKQANVAAFGGQGWVTGFALVRYVLKKIFRKN